ncbi:zinc-dependent alcohol dehydrogenase family protein [Paenibacillus sedimenti]|uniref:Zinc-dependent alcohol dehydrogenase family protein n=1 Tax=Paenibacillus sedimenti TaxID=2770274 RepID=A0A926KR06_9BACL|nr:zinc-dependent alcohol dehydrogenase family protein [Paenibacillus sedimenti]MBD0381336.1 zinc-dependent alcohol dehydrogenase family protein [Paenibacillus sedimenti]
MRALVIEGPRKASIQEVAYPEPAAGEVTIKVQRTGICGTDFHIFEGEFISPFPIIPGHEFSGTIHKIGEYVTGLQVGDRVSADPSLFCGACDFCLTHRGNQCVNWNALGNTVNGSMAEYVSMPAKNVFKIPDTMSFAEAAFIEPIACVVHAMNRLQLQVGNRVLLFGAGAMGQQLVQAIEKVGASELVVVDKDQDKLNAAIQFGATKGILVENVEKELSQAHYPYGFDIVVDATGIPAVIEKALDYMGPCAKYLQFGVTPEHSKISINPFKLYNKDWTLIGSMAINHTFLPALHWIKEGRIVTEPLISKVISLEETVEFLAHPKDPSILKVQISF